MLVVTQIYACVKTYRSVYSPKSTASNLKTQLYIKSDFCPILSSTARRFWHSFRVTLLCLLTRAGQLPDTLNSLPPGSSSRWLRSSQQLPCPRPGSYCLLNCSSSNICHNSDKPLSKPFSGGTSPPEGFGQCLEMFWVVRTRVGG